MNPGDYTFDENSTMKITTKDTVYNINGNDCHLENDTLIAEVSKKLDRTTSLKFNVSIPVEDIEEVEIERTDALATVLIGIGIVAGALVLAFFISTDFTGNIY
jgi:PDZ domain-containing secreted protein